MTIERDLIVGQDPAGGNLLGPDCRHAGEQACHNEHWRAVPFEPDSTVRFDYQISMGLRTGEPEWKRTLDAWIAGHAAEISSILKSYRIPVVDAAGHVEM